MPDPIRYDNFTSAAPNATPAGQAGEVDAQAFAIEAARLLDEDKCQEVMIFDTRGISPVTDFVVLASGTSDRQLKAVGGHISELGRTVGFDRYGSDRDEGMTWLVYDFVEVMVHLFEPATRAHYDMEMLWGDAPRVAWHRG